MSIDQERVIDSINTTPDSKEILLSITDHLSWGNSSDTKDHIYKLQQKIKAYLDFVEDGEFGEKYPEHKDKPITIKIIAKYELPSDDIVKKFYEYALKIVTDAGMKFNFSVFKE